MATFDEQLPEWHESGVEPPESNKDSGFEPGDKPPAQWFNWLLNRTYKVLQELRAKVAFKADVGDMSTVPTTAKTAAGAITELHEAIQEIDPEIPDGSVTPAKLSFDPATQAELDAHVADYIRHPGYGTTAGPANAYTLALAPALTAYAAGVCVAVKIHAANTAASTINVNGLGAKSILDSKGAAMASGKLKTDSIYTLRFNGSAFILQGEGGGGGNATAAQILAGRTATVDDGEIIGTMPNKTGYVAPASLDASAATKLYVTPPAGYYPGGVGNALELVDVDFVPANIRADKNLFGLQGSIPVKGNNPTSGHEPAIEMTYNSSGRLYLKAPKGVYDIDCWIFTDDPDFIASNIRSGVSLFGVVGTLSPGGANLSAPTLRKTASLTYVSLKKITMSYTGTVRVSFELGTPSTTAWGRIYKNGIAAGIERTVNNTSITYTEDFTCAPGDYFEVMARSVTASTEIFVLNLKIQSVLESPQYNGVINVD